MLYGGIGMREFNMQDFRTRFQEIPKQDDVQKTNRIAMFGFFAGLLVFFIWGGNIISDTDLLTKEALKAIRDSTIDKKDFFEYVLAKRLLLFGLGVTLWWWGLCRLYLYAALTIGSFMMGAYLYMSLYRYPFTGIFLWFFLFFPHMIFYYVTMICGIMLKSGMHRSREEKIQYLWKNAWKVILLVLFYITGIYCESYLNVPLMQNFLKIF